MAAWRLVIAEDNLLVRGGLVSIVATADDLETVAGGSSVDELYHAVDRELPDVVITDIRMPRPIATRASKPRAGSARRIRTSGSWVLSRFVEPAYALALFDGGTRCLKRYVPRAVFRALPR